MVIKMQKIREYGTVFTIGALGYGTLEILFRGHTHWTMLLTGGACFCFMYMTDRLIGEKSIFVRSLVCGAFVTETEFIVGCLCNKIADMHVWDYSDRPWSVMGQICPGFSALWIALSMPALLLCRFLRKRLSQK